MADIPDNYYLAIADELTDGEAQARIKELRRLCNSVIRAPQPYLRIPFGLSLAIVER
jgi:hypothetical protein